MVRQIAPFPEWSNQPLSNAARVDNLSHGISTLCSSAKDRHYRRLKTVSQRRAAKNLHAEAQWGAAMREAKERNRRTASTA